MQFLLDGIRFTSAISRVFIYVLIWFEEGKDGGKEGRRAGKGRFLSAYLEGS